MSKAIRRLYAGVTIVCVIFWAFLVVPWLVDLWNGPAMVGGIPVTEIVMSLMCLGISGTLIIGNLIENKINAKEVEMRKRGEKLDY